MSDLTPTADATVTCPNCGAQNDQRQRFCGDCGAPLASAGRPEATRGDLELEEVWRAVAVDGFDSELGLEGTDLVCASCGTRFAPFAPAVVAATAVRDTPSARGDLVVLAARCPRCATLGRAVVEAALLDAAEAPPADEVADGGGMGHAPTGRGEVATRHTAPRGATPEHPLGDDLQYFDRPGSTTSLRDEGLLDADGEDRRLYTGEPVETEDGWVLPVQQNAGPGNIAGSGEWPDKHAPPAQPEPVEPSPADDR